MPEVFVGPARRRRRRRGLANSLVISHGVVLDDREKIMIQPIAQLGLPPRIVNRLEEHKVYTIGDLASLEKYDFDEMRHCGEAAVRVCADALARIGIDHDDWGIRRIAHRVG